MNPDGGHNEAGAGPRHAHEYSDATVHSVALLAGAFVVLIVFGFIVAYIAFRVLNGHEAVGPPASPISNVRELPPLPRLQVNGHEDLEEYLKTQQETLDSYGWVDRNNGIVRIPIDRAMKILIQQGLPVRAPQPTGKLQASRNAGRALRTDAKIQSGTAETSNSGAERQGKAK